MESYRAEINIDRYFIIHGVYVTNAFTKYFYTFWKKITF